MDITPQPALPGTPSLPPSPTENSTNIAGPDQTSNSQKTTDGLRQSWITPPTPRSSFAEKLESTSPPHTNNAENNAVKALVETYKNADWYKKLVNLKTNFWPSCTANKNKLNNQGVSTNVPANTSTESENLSVKEKKDLLPFSSLWTTPITQVFSCKTTGLSNDYKVTTTPKNDGMGICKSGDEKARNLWSAVLCRAAPGTAEEGASIANPVEGVESKGSVNTTNNVDSSNSKKRIFAGLRSAAWIPISGSTLKRQWIRLKTWVGCDHPPGEQRLQDTMKAVLELQADDPQSAAYKAINDASKQTSKDNPLTLSMFSNSLVSGCVIGGKDPEGYLQDMQLRLIEYANKSKAPFQLKVKDNKGNEKSVWVKPDIMMLSAPVQKWDRRLMSWSLSLLGRRNHTSNMNAVAQLAKKHSAYKQKKFEELKMLVTGDKQKEACELALNIRADQELMDEILEMSKKPKDLKSGMYGSNDGNPHAFNARMAVLASRMGITPITNCKTGKDRTEDSLVAQQLLAAEIDDNIQREIQKKQTELDNYLQLYSLHLSTKIETALASCFQEKKTKDVSDFLIKDKKDALLVPKRNFLSAESLKKEIGELKLEQAYQKNIFNAIDGYSSQTSNNNLYETIKKIGETIGDDHKQKLNQLLEKFEHTARQRMAFSHSEAGFTIQMLNNKIEEKKPFIWGKTIVKELIWGNKQPRYSDYYFGLSKDEIDAHKKFMKPPVSVGA